MKRNYELNECLHMNFAVKAANLYEFVNISNAVAKFNSRKIRYIRVIRS